MVDATRQFKRDTFFSYRWQEKYRTGVRIIVFFIFLFIIAFLTLLSSRLSGLPGLPPSVIRVFETIATAVSEGRPAGVLLVSFAGGLFFLLVPLELIYLNYLRMGVDPLNTYLMFMLGVVLAHSSDYWIGLKLSRLVRFLIPPRKFYGLKGILNRYGKISIFVINMLPLPSPAFSAILGAFRYRPILFFTFAMSGQAVLYGFLTLFHFYFAKLLNWSFL